MRTGLEHACAYVVCVHDKTCTDDPRVVFRVPAIVAAALCALVDVAAALCDLDALAVRSARTCCSADVSYFWRKDGCCVGGCCALMP